MEDHARWSNMNVYGARPILFLFYSEIINHSVVQNANRKSSSLIYNPGFNSIDQLYMISETLEFHETDYFQKYTRGDLFSVLMNTSAYI